MTKRVLVVDDERDIANLERAALAGAGFDVTIASSGPEALESASASLPDAIVLDVMMPGMDGWEVARRLREDSVTSAIPILMLTAQGLGEESVPAFVHIDEYYTKPFEPRRLVKLVRQLTEKKREPKGAR
ncbi:MAG: response regulator [Actinomycetia bacterium]|nr:response regulator [Actinomycetes bacterium]